MARVVLVCLARYQGAYGCF